MKKAIKLLVLAGALLSVGAMAVSNNTTQTWHFGFPVYAYIFTNVSDVYFDFTNDDPDGNTETQDKKLTTAGLTGFNNCISQSIVNTAVDGKTFTAEATPNSDLIDAIDACTFAPSGLKDAGNFSVTWPDADGDSTAESADAAILVVTNSSTYRVDASLDSNPNGATFMIARQYSTQIQGASDFSAFDVSSIITDSNDLTTNYHNVYAAPLSFAVQVSTSTDAVALDNTTYKVTYTVTAP